MIQRRGVTDSVSPELMGDVTNPEHVIFLSTSALDLNTTKCITTSATLSCEQESNKASNHRSCSENKMKTYDDSLTDPLCKLNLTAASDFAKAFGMTKSKSAAKTLFEGSAEMNREGNDFGSHKRKEAAPPTPGRPVFGFSIGNPLKKNFPSKWDEAEKWLTSPSCHGSPAHVIKRPQQNVRLPTRPDAAADRNRAAEQESFHGPFAGEHESTFKRSLSDVLLKDKFTENVVSFLPENLYSISVKEVLPAQNLVCGSVEKILIKPTADQQHRDMGTETTPQSSVANSRYSTPFKSASPARHNTPTTMSGPLMVSKSAINAADFEGCHLSLLQLDGRFSSAAPNWNSREEEEEEISKSLRHFEIDVNGKSAAECRASLWEEEEKSKSCIRYQREEAKIQAWVNVQSAKAEAKSRKLEVKIQKMRSDLEEKLMKRMVVVHRKAEEWRVTAQLQHVQYVQRVSEQKRRMSGLETYSGRPPCGCFPCTRGI